MTLEKGKSSSRRGHDTSDTTGLELRAVRLRELELKRARGEISCAECRRYVLLVIYLVVIRSNGGMNDYKTEAALRP